MGEDKFMQEFECNFNAPVEGSFYSKLINEIEENLKKTSPERILIIADAIRAGIDLSRIHELTYYDPWFLDQINEIISTEKELQIKGMPEDRENILLLKTQGFSDKRLSKITNKKEKEIILSKVKNYNTPDREETIELMIKVADLSRKGLVNGDISTVMSPRTVLTWAENAEIFDFNIALSFQLTFLNKCDDSEKPIIAEYYQRCFGEDLMNIQSDITLT